TVQAGAGRRSGTRRGTPWRRKVGPSLLTRSRYVPPNHACNLCSNRCDGLPQYWSLVLLSMHLIFRCKSTCDCGLSALEDPPAQDLEKYDQDSVVLVRVLETFAALRSVDGKAHETHSGRDRGMPGHVRAVHGGRLEWKARERQRG